MKKPTGTVGRELRRAVWKANLSLREHYLVVGTQGNVSGIDRTGGIIHIKPSGVAYEELTEPMLVTVTLDGTPVGGGLKPSVDTVHHLALYRLIPSAGGVCHTHSRYATVFSVLMLPVPVLTTGHADVFGRAIPVAPYVGNSGDAIGKAFLKVYRRTGCPVVILGRHGIFAVGETPAKAAFHALMAEHCAEVAYLALTAGRLLGRKVAPMKPSDIAGWHKRYHSSRYGQKKGG